MKPRTIKTIGMIISIIVSLMVAGSGIAMVLGINKVTDGLTKAGVGDYVPILGIMHILFVLLFIYPKTLKLGFLLLCCYFGGAIATELSHGEKLEAILPLTLIWIGAFLRDRDIFFSKSKIFSNEYAG